MAAMACGAPVARGPSGKPVFDRSAVRHPRNQPFFCFKAVDSKGDTDDVCESVKESCAQAVGAVKAEGGSVVSGCVEVDAVSCFVMYVGGIGSQRQAYCRATPDQCSAQRAYFAKANGTDDSLSACERLDRTFEPEH